MSDTNSRKRPHRSKKYDGFTLELGKVTEFDRVSRDISARDFFEAYIAQRKPCILPNPCKLSIDELRTTAGNANVQVEQRYSSEEAFGQNRTKERQVIMTVNEFLDKASPNYYLSTQDTEDAFSAPTRQLIEQNVIPQTVPWAGNLTLQTCNVWLGFGQGCTGLHHDYHDNFYCLMEGKKEFRLYAPSDHQYMGTFGGEPANFHPNGLITYESTLADGAPLGILEENDKDEDITEEDNEETIVIGKGFDYQSDSADEEYDDNDVDDYEELVEADDEKGHRPKNFSRIDLTKPRSQLLREHHDLGNATELVVELEAGDCLYLPASWFHCVTSRPGSKYHLAVNYWYHPPSNLSSYITPYPCEVDLA